MEYKGKKLRHEIKYVISHLEYEQLRSKLKYLLPLDENAKNTGGYHIRSLYFDDIYNNAYNTKEDGVFFRRKYRIRIYNYSAKKISLEIKEKYDKYISKVATTISMETYTKILNGTLEHNDVKDDEILTRYYIESKANLLKPRVIVDYKREPYVYSVGNVRITFDMGLSSVLSDVDIFNMNQTTIPVMSNEQMVLEVKYDDYLPKFIDKVIRMYQHQILSVSKYVLCCDMHQQLSWKENI